MQMILRYLKAYYRMDGSAVMNKTFVALFSYNRHELLRNAVASIDKYLPNVDVAIFDDQSDDIETINYLKKMDAEGRWEVFINPHRRQRTFGGFYENIHRALKMAIDGGYDYCYLAEDDGQFVRDASVMIKEAQAIFSNCKDAIVICPWFIQRSRPMHVIKNDGTKEWRMEFVENGNAYRSNIAFNTTGVFDLGRIRAAGGINFIDSYGDSFAWNSGQWLSKGYFTYFFRMPYVAMLPWVVSRASGLRNEDLFDQKNDSEFLLTPMKKDEIKYFQDRDVRIPPFQEYARLSTKNWQRPTWFRSGELLDQYYRLCHSVIESEIRFGSSPLRLPYIKDGDASFLVPNANHLKRFKQFSEGLLEDEKTGLISKKQFNSTYGNLEIVKPTTAFRYMANILFPKFLKSYYIQLEASFQNLLANYRRKYGNDVQKLVIWYFGYLKLCRQLRREQRNLPYKLDRSS